ncbi:MAG: hypothetical protein QW298_01915 [Candidatus Micrarchaeaceae archaeon]
MLVFLILRHSDAPIDLQNLVGWWPLNGNNGVPSSVTFVGNWYSGYTPP